MSTDRPGHPEVRTDGGSEQGRVSQSRRERAAEFWDGFDIPADHDTAINVVRSGLLRGSNGSGRNASSVTHLYFTEGFSEGRLSREEGELLCEPSQADRNGREERHVEDGEEYVPRVTCSTCRDRMERWEVDA